MKTLYLVRHAKSSWKEPSLQDEERPLNKRGKLNSAFMGQLMKEKNEIPDLMISSPAKRAYATAKRLAKEMKYKKKKIKLDKELYMGWNTNFIDIVADTKKDVNKLMLISHNPGITEFANYISGSNIENIPTCGITRIDFDTDSWSDVKNLKGTLNFFEYPKKHAAEG